MGDRMIVAAAEDGAGVSGAGDRPACRRSRDESASAAHLESPDASEAQPAVSGLLRAGLLRARAASRREKTPGGHPPRGALRGGCLT